MAGISGEVKVEILAKVKSGQKVSELAKQYGVSDKTIYNWLRAIDAIRTCIMQEDVRFYRLLEAPLQ